MLISEVRKDIRKKNVRRREQGLKYSSVVKHFPNRSKALGSSPNTGRKKKKKRVQLAK